MTDQEVDIELWGAFLLGARSVAIRNGRELSIQEINSLAETAQALAESSETLEDPTTSAMLDPRIGELLLKLTTINIRNQRALAKRIHCGFKLATGPDLDE